MIASNAIVAGFYSPRLLRHLQNFFSRWGALGYKSQSVCYKGVAQGPLVQAAHVRQYAPFIPSHILDFSRFGKFKGWGLRAKGLEGFSQVWKGTSPVPTSRVVKNPNLRKMKGIRILSIFFFGAWFFRISISSEGSSQAVEGFRCMSGLQQ